MNVFLVAFTVAWGSWRTLGTERSYCLFCLLLQSVCIKCESSSPRGGKLIPLTRGEVWKHDEELSVPRFITSPSHLQLYRSWGWAVRRRGLWMELILQTNTRFFKLMSGFHVKMKIFYISSKTKIFLQVSHKTEKPLLTKNTSTVYFTVYHKNQVLASLWIFGFTILLPATKKASNHVITLIHLIELHYWCQTHSRWPPWVTILIQHRHHRMAE